MPVDIAELLHRPEAEEFDRKSALDPTSAQDFLELAADLIAMANTRGGGILIGTDGSAILNAHVPLFDSARIDDRINSVVEPRIGGVRSSVLADHFVWIEIEKSENAPHIFKQDGTYLNKYGKNACVFRKGDVYVRHSSKSERASRADFDRWFEERQQRLFENVRLIFEASPNARVQIAEGAGGVPVRIDPDAPGAQPVYDLLTTEPFRNLQQELTGGLKGWKTSHQLLNESQIYKAYVDRQQINDPEVLELLLRSGWERHIQGYCWAAKLDAGALLRVLRDAIAADHYPSSQEALKVAALLPRDDAKPLFRLVEESARKSVKKATRKLAPVLRARAKKYEALVTVLFPGQKLSYVAGEGVKEVKVDAINEGTFQEILGFLLDGKKENRAAFKAAELFVYGRLVTLIDFSALPLPVPQVADASASAEQEPRSNSKVPG